MALGLTLKSIVTGAIGLLVFFALLPYIIDNITGLNTSGFTGIAALVAPFIAVAAIVGILIFVLNAFGGSEN